MKKLSLILLFVLFSCSLSFAASQICDEDFEGVTAGCVPEMDPTGGGEISRAARTFHNDCSSCTGGSGSGCDAGKNGAFLASGGNPGQCARADVGPSVGGDSYSEPKWRFDNNIGGGKIIYIKFDLKQDSNLDGEYTDLKFTRITSHTNAGAASSSYWHPQLQLKPSSSSCSWYTWSQQGGCYGEYYFSRATTKTANSLEDNAWHTYEIYIDVGNAVVTDKYDASADGIVRLWEDSVLILEDEAVPMRCSSGEGQAINSMAFLRHIYSLSPNQGYLYFDNIEVWDGMPEGPPTLNTAVIASNGTTLTLGFSENVTQGSGYNDSDWDIDASVTGNNIGITYVSGDTTATHIYTIDSEIQVDEVANIDFNGDANSEEDDEANDLAAISNGSVTNNSTQGSDVTPPELSLADIASNGTTLTLTFDEAVTQGSGYNDSDLDVDASITGSNIAVSYSSGDGTSSHVYIVDQVIIFGETVDIDFNGDTNSLEDGAGNDLAAIVSGLVTNNSTQEVPDSDPPLPDPMTWSTEPYGYDAETIAMEGTTGSHDSTPIEYYFNYDQGDSQCGSDGGTGGTDSGWQIITLWNDEELQFNKCYGYAIQARDAVPNTGTPSEVYAVYTLANVPGAPILSNPTLTTLDIGNGANGNPSSNPTTTYAQQCTATSPNDATWLNKWIDASGDPSDTEVWLSDATWDAMKLEGLEPGTDYDVKSKARNGDNVATDLSSAGQGTTTEAGEPVPSVTGATGTGLNL